MSRTKEVYEGLAEFRWLRKTKDSNPVLQQKFRRIDSFSYSEPVWRNVPEVVAESRDNDTFNGSEFFDTSLGLTSREQFNSLLMNCPECGAKAEVYFQRSLSNQTLIYSVVCGKGHCLVKPSPSLYFILTEWNKLSRTVGNVDRVGFSSIE